MSVHDDGLSGHLAFEARPSWTGAVVDDPNADPLVGSTLHETYQVTRVIGEGGMGRVYEARHTRIASKRYAIKVLHTEFARNPEIRSRFQHEAEAAAAIGHPGVVGTYDVGETPGERPYMVCEYLAGEDLNDYLLEHRTLPAHTVVHIGRQLCSALAAAHARGVIHRDLKPHNIFVMKAELPPKTDLPDIDELPTVKVLDFGLSRFTERDNDLTKTGIILGTPGYMAPEQAGGLGTDHRTDIYGIGALLYAMATGRPPFKEDSPQQTVLSVLSSSPPRPREIVPSVPIDLEIVIQRAMARDPQERYQSADEVDAALAQLGASSTLFDRRAKGAGLLARAPRLELLLLMLAWLSVAVPAAALALMALLQAQGVDYLGFRPSTLEWLLLVLLGLFLLFPLFVAGRHFKKNVWGDSARVSDLLPKVRRPLVGGTLAYGASALVLFSAWGLGSLATGGFDPVPAESLFEWLLVPAACAFLVASSIVVWDVSRKFDSPYLRAVTGVGVPTGAAFCAIVLLSLSVSAPARVPSVKLEAAPVLHPQAMEGGGSPRAASTKTAAGSRPAPKVSAEPSAEAAEVRPDARVRAPAGELAQAQSQGVEALEELAKRYPEDGKVLQALVLLHASRADTLTESVKALSRLFEVDSDLAGKADMLFILKKAFLARGDAHKTAFAIVSEKMGTEGGELVYLLLNENPKQRDRLKKAFFELRKTDLVSPATAIAYDLRYATSCRGRLSLLDRAEKDGDLRSIRQLQALSTAPKKCGWGRKCKPICPAEAGAMRKTIGVIEARLDGLTAQ